MTAQELKNSILQLAVQGKLVPQNSNDTIIDLTGLKLKKTDEYEFEVPSCWKLAHLESVTISIPTKQYQILESEVRKSGKYSVVSQSKAGFIGFTDDERKLYKHEKPVVIFGDHTTEIKYIDFDFVVGADGVKIFEPINNIIYAKFLFYVLQLYSKDLSKLGGYTRHYKYIKNKPIPLPPLAEQKRIVEKIEELMPLIEEYGKAEEQLSKLNAEFPDKLRKSILQQAVQGKLTERDPADEPASELLKRIKAEKEALTKAGKIKKEKSLPAITDDEKPFDIPDTWEWVRLDDIAYQIGDIDHKMPSTVRSDGVPYISPLNFTKDGEIDFDGAKQISMEDFLHLSQKCIPEKNDIIFPRYGTIGVVRMVSTNRRFLVSYSCCTIKNMEHIMDPKYIFYVLQTKLIKDEINRYINKTTQPNVGLKSIKMFLFPLPPLAEQKRIVKRVEELLALCDELKYNPLGE